MPTEIGYPGREDQSGRPAILHPGHQGEGHGHAERTQEPRPHAPEMDDERGEQEA